MADSQPKLPGVRAAMTQLAGADAHDGERLALGRQDAHLVQAVRSGDDGAFERIYERYQRRIASYVRGMVSDHARAEDVTQEVFISALRRLRATEQTIILKPWLYEIARNACIDQYRRSQRSQEVSYDGAALRGERLVAPGPSPHKAVDTKQQLDHLTHAFSELHPAQHEMLVMRELEGLSYREIGERMDLTRPAVESALFRARKRLIEEYEELSSGDRCVRVQHAISAPREGWVGSASGRERRRAVRHVSRCGICRAYARRSGIELEPRRGLPERVAALLPFPALLRRIAATRVASSASRTIHRPAFGASSGPLGDAATGLIAAGAAAVTVTLAAGGAVAVKHLSAGASPSPSAATGAPSPSGTTGAPPSGSSAEVMRVALPSSDSPPPAPGHVLAGPRAAARRSRAVTSTIAALAPPGHPGPGRSARAVIEPAPAPRRGPRTALPTAAGTPGQAVPAVAMLVAVPDGALAVPVALALATPVSRAQSPLSGAAASADEATAAEHLTPGLPLAAGAELGTVTAPGGASAPVGATTSTTSAGGSRVSTSSAGGSRVSTSVRSSTDSRASR